MRIDVVEFDDENTPHVTSHGVTIAQIEEAFRARPLVRRNKGDRSAGYYIIANGIRVNFLYRPGVARPISAWRMS